MAQNKPEVITLLSSDEETPPLVSNLLNTKTDVKARKTARKSTSPSMSQLSIIPIKPERTKRLSPQNSALAREKDKANVSQPKLNNTSRMQNTSIKKPMHESNNINTLNCSTNVTNSIIDIEKSITKPSVNGLPPVEIAKKMPHLTITPVGEPSDPPVVRNSRTARKSVSSTSGRHSSPEVQMTATKLNKSRTYQNNTKLPSERNQPARISPSSIKTAVQPPNSNKVTLNDSSHSNSISISRKGPEKSHGGVKDSLYVETLKKKARKSFPSSNQLPPSLILSLDKSGVSITNVENSNLVNSELVGNKSEEVFDPKSLKISPDISITKVKPDVVSVIESSNDKIEHGGKTPISQASMAQSSLRQLNANNKSQISPVSKSKVNKGLISEYFSHTNSETSIIKVPKDDIQSSSVSRKSSMINTNEPSTGKCIQNDCSSKNNSNLSKPQTRAQRSGNLNVKKSSISDKLLADSESDIIILPDTIQTPSINQKPVGPVFPASRSLLKSTLTKTGSSDVKRNVSVTDQLKKNQPLKRKNSNSISNPKPSKKVSFETPPNGLLPNSALVDHHKRIEAIKESLKGLNNDLKQQQKTDKSLDNVASTKKDLANPLPSVGEKKKDAIIPLPYHPEKKRHTIIPLPYHSEKKKNTIIPLPFREEKKIDNIIPLPYSKEIKKDTVISLPHVEEKKNDRFICLAHVEETDTIGRTSEVEKEASIPLPYVDESIAEGVQMGGKELKSFDEVQNFENLSNKATNDGKYEEATLDVPPERPLKQITSPKLSLKRKTTSDETSTDETHVKKSKVSQAAFEKVCSPLQNPDLPDMNSFPWEEDDDISTKYKKFLHFCMPLMKSSPQEINKIVKTFLKQFQKADINFIDSTNFIELLCKTVLKVKTNPGEIFVHLATLNSRLREHKKIDFSSPQSSSNERSKSTNHVKHISSDKHEIASHSSSNELKATVSDNHLEQSTSKDSEVASHLSSFKPRVVGSADHIEQNSSNKLESASHLSNDNLKAIDCANHSKEMPDIVPEITFDVANLNEPENFGLTNGAGQMEGNVPEIQSDFSNLNDKLEFVESTNHSETISADKPGISTNFDDPRNDEYSPSLIPSNPIESTEPDDSRSSANVFNPTVIESSVKGSCMNEFYSRPSTSKQADYAAMLLSSKLPGNTLEEIERESYRLPLDDLTKDSIENHQDYLMSKKVANSIPDSELPIPTINPDIRDSHLEKGSGSDSTVSFPDKKSNSNIKKDIAPKHKMTIEDKLEIRIRKLEKFLGKLDKRIKKLRLKELSLDDLDDDDSAYVDEEKYIKKFNKVFATLCKLRKSSSHLGREIEKRFTYEGSRYEAINKAIEKLVNKRKAAEKFPNYKETLDKVREVNESHQIGLTSRDEERVAEQIFRDVGKELQKRRILDEEQDLISYCPDDIELDYDPADHDESLKSKLISSAAEAEKKIDEIMQKYVEMQTEEEKVNNKVMEVEETSEDEQEDSDVPETEPANSSTDERMDEIEPECKPLKEDLPAPISNPEDPDIIDIGSSSDASTEPGASVSENRISEVRPSLLTGGPPLFISDEIEVFEDSNPGCNSSPELRPLEDLFK